MAHLSTTSTACTALLVLALCSCQKQVQRKDSQSNQSTIALAEGVTKMSAANKVVVTEMQFGPVTTNFVNNCYENIRFEGMIENREHVVTTNNGNHYSRQFVARGLTGIGVLSGDTYTVIGGSEMFSVKNVVFNQNGSLNLPLSLSSSDIVIHQGTLVFESDRRKIVARHVIRKVPGREETINQWICH